MRLFNTIYADTPISWGFGFQDPASPWSYALIDLHDRIIFYLIILLVIVSWFLISSFLNKDHMAYTHHGSLIELIWTLMPAIILWSIGLPSLRLLYLMDELLDAELTVKVLGNQWYWSAEYSDFADSDIDITFDSYMVAESDLELGDLRQLTVDNPLVLPVNTSIRILVTSNDVIHSFTVPSLAFKLDAMPGRLNSTGILITRPSTYYGQCSELCGALHGFMPIQINAVSLESFINWVLSHKEA